MGNMCRQHLSTVYVIDFTLSSWFRVPLTIPTRPMNTQSSSDDRGDEQAEEDRVPLTLTGVIGPNGSGKSKLFDENTT